MEFILSLVDINYMSTYNNDYTRGLFQFNHTERVHLVKTNQRGIFLLLTHIISCIGAKSERIFKATKTAIDWFHVILYVFNYV